MGEDRRRDEHGRANCVKQERGTSEKRQVEGTRRSAQKFRLSKSQFLRAEITCAITLSKLKSQAAQVYARFVRRGHLQDLKFEIDLE